MINKEIEGVKFAGARPFDYYVDGLKQVLNVEELQPKQQPSLASLLEQEKLLFSKEIEVMYDIESSDMNTFIEKELSPDLYQAKEILGELYITTTKNNV